MNTLWSDFVVCDFLNIFTEGLTNVERLSRDSIQLVVGGDAPSTPAEGSWEGQSAVCQVRSFTHNTPLDVIIDVGVAEPSVLICAPGD